MSPKVDSVFHSSLFFPTLRDGVYNIFPIGRDIKLFSEISISFKEEKLEIFLEASPVQSRFSVFW